ncbi:hypothetical protein [Methanoregula sp.]|uniref:hypothetical protein n=1 Tax=Methanoregula sp. TaxID=2052170 RepID=UPI003C743B04
MIRVDPKTDTQGFVAVDVINIDHSIKDATPYYYLLVLSKEGKQNYLRDLDTVSSVEDVTTQNSTAYKAELTRELKALWDKYPVISETSNGDLGYPSYGGTITTMKFSPLVKGARLSDEENKLLETIQSLMKKSYEQKLADTVSPMWAGSPSHANISYWAAYKESFPQPNTVAASAPVPDTWPSVLPEPFATLYRSINHYYNPNNGVGNAPGQTATYINAANSQYKVQYYTQAATDLGYASHFLEDVGNPMHTGRETDQYSNPWVHFNYESYVANRWYSSNFDYVVKNNNNYYWYTDWAQGTKDLATYSNGYLDTIYTKVYNKGQTNLAQDSSIDAISQNLIQMTAKYTNGLALYARIG